MPYKVIVEGATRGLMGDSCMETSVTILADKVNEAITDGGQPLGRIAHSENRQENPFFLQAMINHSTSSAVMPKKCPPLRQPKLNSLTRSGDFEHSQVS